ncbi:MAG TPA: helix-turn-helix domain-containing protein [Streptosporangiaceae bacterium]|jgi:AraC-like DNA-binding protein
MSILIRNDHLPEGERFECWREVACQVRLAAVEVESDHQAHFRFALRYSDLGATRVSVFTVTPYRVLRTPKLIRRSDPERLSIGMVLRGHGSIVSQSGRQARIPSSAFTLYDNSRPYTIDLAPATGAGAARGLILNFPRTLLPLPPDKVNDLTALTMPAGPGIGALTARLLVQLTTGMDHYTPAEAARLSTAALDVLATRLAHELDGDRWVAPETHRRALQVRIHAFIQQHLGDPDLTPAAIAEVHHISLRLLHKLFHEQGETVAGWIRARRLEACRRDLIDPTQVGLPVAAVAARWGFQNAIHFSRLFRATYGLPPREYRRSIDAAAGRADRRPGRDFREIDTSTTEEL